MRRGLMRRGVMRRGAFVAALALCAPLAWFGDPAQAYLCAPVDVADKLAAGAVLAVVTRTDTDGGHGSFRVEQTEGGRLPATVGGGGEIPHAGVAAVVVNRAKGTWVANGTCPADLAEALDRMNGAPVAGSTEAVAAVLADRFGGSRLAAIDARGEVVAWDRRPGQVVNLAVCPQGRTVVAHAYPGPDSTIRELTVHDAGTLDVLGTLDKSALEGGFVTGLRRTYPTGSTVQAIVTDQSGSSQTRLATIGPGRTEEVDLGSTSPAHPVDFDGFLGSTTTVGSDRLRLLETRPAGPGSRFASVANEPVTYSRTRLAFAGSDALRSVENPRLAGAWTLAPLDSAPPPTARPLAGPPLPAEPLTAWPVSTGAAAPTVLAGLAVVAVGLGLAGRRGRRA